jgi:acetolactate synthase-1/2/3 large subunit
VPEIVREAFRIAEEEKPGSVHIELPEDIAGHDTNTPLYNIYPKTRPRADESVIRQAAAMIESARSPLILIGAGAMRKLATEAVKGLIEKTAIPFFNTQMAKGLIDERDPLFLGTAALSAHDYLHCAIGKSDLIINIGHDIIEKPPFIMEKGGTKVIHVNFFFSRVDDVYFPQLDVVGDISVNIKALTKMVNKQASWDLEVYCRIKEDLDQHLQSGADDPGFPVKPQRVVADIRKAMPDDGILTLDNGIYKIWFARNYRAYMPNTILLDNALASMGAGFPSAIGAKMVHPDKKVLAVCGDGGFMMNSQEIETAVRLGLNIVCLILRDGAYGMVKWKQRILALEEQGLDFGNPDLVKYAESYGATGHRIGSAQELLPVAQQALNGSGVQIIDCPIDYSENTNVLIDELRQLTCKI